MQLSDKTASIGNKKNGRRTTSGQPGPACDTHPAALNKADASPTVDDMPVLNRVIRRETAWGVSEREWPTLLGQWQLKAGEYVRAVLLFHLDGGRGVMQSAIDGIHRELAIIERGSSTAQVLAWQEWVCEQAERPETALRGCCSPTGHAPFDACPKCRRSWYELAGWERLSGRLTGILEGRRARTIRAEEDEA